MNGRYRLIDLIGVGGMGRVFLADDELLDRRVAVKELTPLGSPSPAVMREARAAARLDHPGVVRVYDVLWQTDRCWIVMEYVPSISLHQAAPLSHREAARIGLGILEALRAAHAAGVLHGDVKPHNVLLADDGRVLLTDFGLATVDSNGPDPTLGSPQYLAPERINREPSGPPADLWSLGATLHAAVEGGSPFARDTAEASMIAVIAGPPDAPARRGPLTPIIERLLARDPAERLTIDQAEPLLRRVADRTMGIFPVPAAAIADGRRRLARSTRISLAVAAALVVATTGTALAREAVTGRPSATPSSAAPLAICDDLATPGSPIDADTPRGYLPPGWIWHDDPHGFGLALPPGWTSESAGEAVCFRDPGSTRSLRVREIATPAEDPVAMLRRDESAAVGALPGYLPAGIASVASKAGGAAWRFSWQPTDGPRRYERRLVLLMGQGRAYALEWTSGDEDEAFVGRIVASLTLT